MLLPAVSTSRRNLSKSPSARRYRNYLGRHGGRQSTEERRRRRRHITPNNTCRYKSEDRYSSQDRYNRYSSEDRRRSYVGRHRHSRSPLSSRKRHVGDRENPEPSRVIGVFGMSSVTTERDLNILFSRYGRVQKLNIVYDRKTGNSRGFGFIYYEKTEHACLAKQALNEAKVDGNRIRIAFSITERAHTPTPGIYLGKRMRGERNRRRSFSSEDDRETIHK